MFQRKRSLEELVKKVGKIGEEKDNEIEEAILTKVVETVGKEATPDRSLCRMS